MASRCGSILTGRSSNVWAVHGAESPLRPAHPLDNGNTAIVECTAPLIRVSIGKKIYHPECANTLTYTVMPNDQMSDAIVCRRESEPHIDNSGAFQRRLPGEVAFCTPSHGRNVRETPKSVIRGIPEGPAKMLVYNSYVSHHSMI